MSVISAGSPRQGRPHANGAFHSYDEGIWIAGLSSFRACHRRSLMG
jgi:hypothetical protein